MFDLKASMKVNFIVLAYPRTTRRSKDQDDNNMRPTTERDDSPPSSISNPNTLEFTVFPELLAEDMELKAHAPRWLMEKREIYPDDYDWAADQAAALRDLEFSTDTKACDHFGGCTAAREIILGVYQIVVESKGGKKIRFDGDNDTILLCTRKSCQLGQSPFGEIGNAVRCRDYTNIFSGMKRLIWTQREYFALFRSSWVVAQFPSRKDFILIIPSPQSLQGTDETHWEPYQKQLVYLEVRTLLSLEDLFSSKISTAKDWVRYLKVENKNCRTIQ
ncbi:hypothetical protein V8E51_001659 [Hyaloscypha variabilis]